MATCEENINKINEQLENLTDEELEKVAAGKYKVHKGLRNKKEKSHRGGASGSW